MVYNIYPLITTVIKTNSLKHINKKTLTTVELKLNMIIKKGRTGYFDLNEPLK